MSPPKFLPNLSTDGQENATFEAKNTNPHAPIPKPDHDPSSQSQGFVLLNRWQRVAFWLFCIAFCIGLQFSKVNNNMAETA